MELVPLLDKDFPPELRQTQKFIRQQCTRHGSIPESVPKLSDREAIEVAQRILELDVQLRITEGPEGDWCGEFVELDK